MISSEFRKSMTWIHTWLGLLAGWILYAVFFTGTISYYHKELSIWMKPETVQSTATENTSLVAAKVAMQALKNVDMLYVTLPSQRQNTISTMNIATDPETKKRMKVSKNYDATTGEEIETRKTAGGGFLYKFHVNLYGVPKNVGEWIVGIATFFMLITIVTGVLIHKRIFKDIFVFRPDKKIRNWMDGHILISIAALPFFIMITYSGLILSLKFMMPWAVEANYDNYRTYNQELRKDLTAQNAQPINTIQETKSKQEYNKENMSEKREKRDNSENRKSRNKKQTVDFSEEKLAEIYKKANEIWPDNIGTFQITKDAKSGNITVTFRQKNHNTIFYSKAGMRSLVFDGNSGKLKTKIDEHYTDNAILATQASLMSLHFAWFANSATRFAFFVFGILGTLIIATGLVLWSKKRESKYENKNHIGYRIVEVLNIGTIVGMFIAFCAYLSANRFLPVDMENRAVWEINIFFIAWLTAYIWASLRGKKAWMEQALFCSVFFIALIFINLFTTNITLSQYLHGNAFFIYFDAFFLVCAGLFYFVYKKAKNKLGVNNAN